MPNERQNDDQASKQPPSSQSQSSAGSASTRKASQPGKPTSEQPTKAEVGRVPKTPAVAKPVSTVRPGGASASPQRNQPGTSNGERRAPDGRADEGRQASTPINSRNSSPVPRTPPPGARERGGDPARATEKNGADEVYHQRVFDPTAEDTLPARGGHMLGSRDRGPQRDRGTGAPSTRPPQSRPSPADSRRGGEQRRPAPPATPARGGGSGRRSQPASRNRPSDAGQTPASKLSAAPPRQAAAQPPVTEITIPETITVRDLAEQMRRSPIDIIKTLMNYGMMVPITESIDFDTAQLIGEEMGIAVSPERQPEPEVVEVKAEAPKTLRQQIMAEEKSENLVLRPPVVTVLGHVDHGKTTLLDAIRETRVVDGEAGGITQHVGAYQVDWTSRKITFLDTPGHEAFTAMRARGAMVTDIAVLVVAADDGVMPQTKEAIAHARAAQVPIVVALNKVDKPTANADRVKQELADNGVLIEEYGGDVMCVPVSAKFRRGIGDLLESILLVADIDPLKANPAGECLGTVIESRLDKSRGPTATLLVQNGTLRVGDSIVTGETYAKIRAMYNDKGEPILEASPSTPVQILGLADVPVAGDTFHVVSDERAARALAAEQQEKRKAAATPAPARTLESVFAQAEAGQVKELNLILKADVQGSIEPIANSLAKLGDEKLKVKILHQGTGNVTESDVMLAVASKAIILGFSVVVDPSAQRTAESEGVDIRIYNIIYKMIEDVQKALEGLLEPVYREVVTGHAEVRALFRVSRVGQVAGCYVTDGEIARSSLVRIKRAGQSIAEDRVGSLKRFQEDTPEVKTGFECGISLNNFNDLQVGDVVEAYKRERVS